MNDILRDQILDRSAWTADTLKNTDDWIVHLSTRDLAELDAALKASHPRGAGYEHINREHFTMPHLAATAQGWIKEIEHGRGFVVIRGLPVERYDEASLYALYWGLGCHFGDAIVQNYEGRRINEVRSRGHSYEEVNIRAYATASHLGFHNDPSDLTCLLCVRAAKTGGMSRVASAAAVYNEILTHHPEFLEPLYKGFHHDVRGEGPSGDFDEVTETRIPVYSYCDGKLSCTLNSKAIATARVKMGGALSTLERAALDYIEERAMQPDLRFEFMLEPGDIVMMNNFSVLHARTAFEDWDDPARNRLLLRLWLNLHEGRALAANVTGRFNTGQRGGAVVHKHSDADLLTAGR
jgi:alpha-ketoglutarate-dependent taurine dioxygenase